MKFSALTDSQQAECRRYAKQVGCCALYVDDKGVFHWVIPGEKPRTEWEPVVALDKKGNEL